MSIRLAVNINEGCAELLRTERSRGITVTETTRRAFSVLAWLYREIRDGKKIVVIDRDGSMQEITFLW